MNRPSNIELLKGITRIADAIPADSNGERSLAKTYLMSILALEYNLKNLVEIGGYDGRSFLPLAYISNLLGGMVYGIDPYDHETIRWQDTNNNPGQDVNGPGRPQDPGQTDEAIFGWLDEFGLSDCAKIIREKPDKAVNFFGKSQISIDLLHIDGGDYVAQETIKDIVSYIPLVRDGGFLVLDQGIWAAIKPALDQLKKKYALLFSNTQFTIIAIGSPEKDFPVRQKARFTILHSLIENFDQNRKFQNTSLPEDTSGPLVSVFVISYNQEKYIAECLESIFAQKGNFKIELVIGDDCSSDATPEIIKMYADTFGSNRVEVKILSADKNIGMTRNFQRSLNACTGKYIAVCEGDDYWLDPYKTEKQMAFLKTHPECALCFSDIYLYFLESGEFIRHELQLRLEAEVITTRDIVLDYSIGNLGCCLYDAKFMKSIPDDLYNLYIGDWMFNIYYSHHFGNIGHLKEPMSVYRIHNKGVWSGDNPEKRSVQLCAHIEEYNKFLNYDFDREFTIVQKRFEAIYPHLFYADPAELVIIDDVFPEPHSTLRLQEFSGYLKEFKSSRIYASGAMGSIPDEKNLDELIASYKRKHPEYAGRIRKLEKDSIINARLIYMVSLVTAYANIEKVEQLRTPFVFTLDPDDGFSFNNDKTEQMLTRICASACFRKIIVTRKDVYDYLIEKQYCTAGQIELILATATNAAVKTEVIQKKHFGIDKDTLDIYLDAQLLPRINILKGELELARASKEEINKTLDNPAGKIMAVSNIIKGTVFTGTNGSAKPGLKQVLVKFFIIMKKAIPAWPKTLIKRILLKIRSNEALFRFIKRISPAFLVKIYHKLRESS